MFLETQVGALAGFAGVVLPVVYAPGPSVLLVSSHRLVHGRRAIWPTIAGDLSANVLQMTAVAFGLAALASASPSALQTLEWLGVAYLSWMALRLWTGEQAVDTESPGATPTPTNLFTRGFLVSASNPKALLFFASLFPLFLDSTRPPGAQLVALAVTFVVLDASALLSYSAAAAAVGTRVQSAAWLGRLSGFLMLCAALLLVARRS